jgi:hypothetical protein
MQLIALLDFIQVSVSHSKEFFARPHYSGMNCFLVKALCLKGLSQPVKSSEARLGLVRVEVHLLLVTLFIEYCLPFLKSLFKILIINHKPRPKNAHPKPKINILNFNKNLIGLGVYFQIADNAVPIVDIYPIGKYLLIEGVCLEMMLPIYCF